ncbi:MAG: phosphate transport system protein [Acidimicrobiia bacterium]|nr:phosphate transport system protein [Acidimicrobiia bacterium]
MPDNHDYRKALHNDIDELRVEVVRLAAMVGDVIVRATEALLSYDMDAAAELIMHDDEVDALSIDIEERCFKLLALQQPMASDLRAIVASMKINADIERSGDLMVNVAKGARRMYGVQLPPRLRGLIQQMSDEADRLLRLAVDAFSDRNGPLGAALNDIDDRLDLLQAEFVQAIFEAHAAGDIDLQAAVQLAVICRYYERVGDHAVNIGERVRFMTDGRLPEHEGAARVKARQAMAASAERFGVDNGDPGEAPDSP